MAACTGSRVMIVRVCVAGTAIAQRVIKNSIGPCSRIMAGAALRSKPLVSMIFWRLMTGLTITL
jgi:hypothetical protein